MPSRRCVLGSPSCSRISRAHRFIPRTRRAPRRSPARQRDTSRCGSHCAPRTTPPRPRRTSRHGSRLWRRGGQRAYAIAFFGDSVSVGFGASKRGHGYVSRVSSWLRTHGKRVVTTNNARGGVPVAYWMYSPMPKQLDAAVVELGTNDVRLGTTSSAVRAGLPHAHEPYPRGQSEGAASVPFRLVAPRKRRASRASSIRRSGRSAPARTSTSRGFATARTYARATASIRTMPGIGSLPKQSCRS